MKRNLHSEILNPIREYTFKILDEYSDVNTYTNINRLFRIEKNIKSIIKEDYYATIEIDILFLANYMNHIVEAQTAINEWINSEEVDCFEEVLKTLKALFNLDDNLLLKAKLVAMEALPKNSANTLESKILSDAYVMDFACDLGRDRMKSMYEQMLLRDINISKSNWYDIIIPIIATYQTYTGFGKKEVQPLIEKLNKRLKKEKKDIENRKDLLLQKELAISEGEIKILKKDLKKIKGKTIVVFKHYLETPLEIIIH